MAFNSSMHDRNIYKVRPDFDKIAIEYPEFRQYAIPDEKGKIHVDFNDQDALRAVTKVLLKKDFNLDVVIPKGFLIPTVPQRLNYLLWVEDLLKLLPNKTESRPVSGIDIGTGACAIFSLLGAKKNDWNFISTETSDETIQWAETNIKTNNLESCIKVLKVSKDSILEELLSTNSESYDFCLCNPPFFKNIEEVKRKNFRAKETIAANAKEGEILFDGGEVTFVKNMIRDSLVYKDRICLYTSMFGRKKSFKEIWREIQSTKDVTYTKTEFCQGNTVRWGIAWTFLKSVDLTKIRKPKPKKSKKGKPLSYKITNADEKSSKNVKELLKKMKNIFLDMEILFKVIKSAENYAKMQIAADKNTWSHQRRKKRELLKDKVSSKEQCAQVNLNSVTSGSSETPADSACDKSDASICKTAQNTNLEGVPSTEEILLQDKLEGSVDNSAYIKFDSLTPTEVVKDLAVSKIEQTAIVNTSMPNDDPIIDAISSINSFNCSQLLTFQKRKREIDSSEYSKSKKHKEETETFECTMLNLKSEQQKHSSENDTTENDIISKPCGSELTLSSKIKSDSDTSAKRTKLDSNLNDTQNMIFDSKSLLFCTLEIRKAEDNILLVMNCPPEANRKSLHEVFQFLKNKFINT